MSVQPRAETIAAYKAALRKKAARYSRAATSMAAAGNRDQAVIYREVAAELLATAGDPWPD